jgi:hypothetical protein
VPGEATVRRPKAVATCREHDPHARRPGRAARRYSLRCCLGRCDRACQPAQSGPCPPVLTLQCEQNVRAGPRTGSTLDLEDPDVPAPRELHQTGNRSPPPSSATVAVSIFQPHSLSPSSLVSRHCPCSASSQLRHPIRASEQDSPGSRSRRRSAGPTKQPSRVRGRAPSLFSSPLLSPPPPQSSSPSRLVISPCNWCPPRPPACLRFVSFFSSTMNLGELECQQTPSTAPAAFVGPSPLLGPIQHLLSSSNGTWNHTHAVAM